MALTFAIHLVEGIGRVSLLVSHRNIPYRRLRGHAAILG